MERVAPVRRVIDRQKLAANDQDDAMGSEVAPAPASTTVAVGASSVARPPARHGQVERGSPFSDPIRIWIERQIGVVEGAEEALAQYDAQHAKHVQRADLLRLARISRQALRQLSAVLNPHLERHSA